MNGHGVMAPVWPTNIENPFDCTAKYRLITQRSRVQIPPPQPNPAKLIHPKPPPSSSDSDLAHVWPTGFSAFWSLARQLFSTRFSTYPTLHLAIQDELQLRRVVDKRLPRNQKYSLSFCVTLVTVLVRTTVTPYVSLCQPLSLRKLCVAPTRAKGALNENSSGLVYRLCSHLACVYAGCHAQPCAGSRTARTPWITAPMSPGLWRVEKDSCCQASAQIGELMQGAPVWGRLAF